MKLLDILLTRLSENSTWRGLILLATSLGLTVEPELQNHIVAVGLAAIGIINVIRKGK